MHRWGNWIGLATAGLVVTGCSASSTSGLTAGELGDADCRRPPWFPQRVIGGGVRFEACESERNSHFRLGSGAPVSDAVAETFLDAHRDELHAIDGVDSTGFGTCCREANPKPNEGCISLGLRLCSTPIPELIDTLLGIQARDRIVARGSLRVSVELVGRTEPRCEADDPACGPIPYGRNMGPVPDARRPIGASAPGEEACAHDGDCVTNGCGNQCDHWTLGGAAGTCLGLTWLENAFCGCVEAQCTWFE